MFDPVRLGRVLIAYETYYKLMSIFPKEENEIISEGEKQTVISKRIMLLKDEKGKVNPNIVQMFNIILEKLTNTYMFLNIGNIETHVPEFEAGVKIIIRELGPSIQNRIYQDIIIIHITQIIDYLFRNFKIFLQNIADRIKKVDDPLNKWVYKSMFTSNIDLLFFFMVSSPDIHKGLLNNDIVSEIAKILKLDNNVVYTDIKERCKKNRIIFIRKSIYYICLYSVGGKSNEELISENKGSNKDLNAFELSSEFGLKVLLGIIRKLRPII